MSEFGQYITSQLPYAPNPQQAQVIEALARFCSPTAPPTSVFVLRGYAGTGKTSLCGALVKALKATRLRTVLLAPTGRAAKVFASYAGTNAYTIHRYIYKHQATPVPQDGMGAPVVKRNTAPPGTIFIVDEASMIAGADDNPNAPSTLLDDLVQYVYSGDDCKLLLMGDTAQLPPVGSDISPAMNADVLRSMGLRVTHCTLTAIARQDADSGILVNATMLRRALNAECPPLPAPFTDRGFNDVTIVPPAELPDMLATTYSLDGLNETIVITRSNRNAVDFNKGIRSSVFFHEDELQVDEPLMIAKNNYFWTRDNRSLPFVANGDIANVGRIYGTEVRYARRWADVSLYMPDRDISFDAKILLSTLRDPSPSMTRDEYHDLYMRIMRDPEAFAPDTTPSQRLEALNDNPYWNALQVKYAYAITCHKAQGGQWQHVFVDPGYVPADADVHAYYRWLYTAVTRARKHLYIISDNTE